MTDSSMLTAIMEAFTKMYDPPTSIHLLGPLVTDSLETLNLSFLRDGQSRWRHFSQKEKTQYTEAASNLLQLAVSQKSVYISR